jgi:hypothetical protein
MPGPSWTKQDDQDLRQLYSDPAVSREALEQRFGRSWMAIKARANTFGLYRRSPRPLSSHPWTEAEEQLLCELYPNMDISRQEIAQRLGRTWRSIQHRIGQLGIKDTRERNNPCQVRRDYFKVIDSDEKAYWLGFIAADGCVYVGGVSIPSALISSHATCTGSSDFATSLLQECRLQSMANDPTHSVSVTRSSSTICSPSASLPGRATPSNGPMCQSHS